MPLISVVIPLYNKEAHIQRTINSVLAQSIQDFEVLTIDDGSTDKSAEVVLSFTDPRIRLIQQENLGVSAARNRGIKESKADLIAFLDADDEWTPIFLETILRLNRNYPQAGAYATAIVYQDSTGKKRRSNYKAIPPYPWEGLVPDYFMSVALEDSVMMSSSVAIPHHVFDDVGLFQIGTWFGEDTDMWGRIALKYSIAFSWEIGSSYNIGATNRASYKKVSIGEHAFIKTANLCIQKGEVPEESLNSLKEYIARLKIESAYKNLMAGDRKKSKEILSKCETRLCYWKKVEYILLANIPTVVYIGLPRIKRRYIDPILKYKQYIKNEN